MPCLSYTAPPFLPARRPGSDMNRGFWSVVLAFLIWGLIPIYFKCLGSLPSTEVVAHRLVWCCFTALLWLAFTGRLRRVAAAIADRRILPQLLGSAVLIGANWLLYVWAVTHDHVIDASLGYFINPLVNVSLGVAVLDERLSRPQWTAVALAALGVLWIGMQSGAPSWIGLGLAVSFGGYGLLRKIIPVDGLTGLASETLLILPIGLGYLGWLDHLGRGAFIHDGVQMTSLLVGVGVVTFVPLALFGYGARHIRYSTVGIIQYLQPSMQLMLGVYIYHEAFPLQKLLGFAVIWIALAVYTADGLRQARREPVVI